MPAQYIQKRMDNASVLIVDDQPISLAILNETLSPHFNVRSATNGKSAILECETNPPDLIVMDVMMPGMDGIKACIYLKAQEHFEDIPIIFSTSLSKTEDETRCWEAGGSDFVAKPIHPVTLLQRVLVHLRLKLQTDYLRDQVITDALTGIYNRRFLDEQGERLLRQNKREHSPMSVVLFDIDFFKQFNDTYGHNIGDGCLKSVARALQGALHRPVDFVCRYGGEEFCAVLPCTTSEGAQAVVENSLQAIHALAIPHRHAPKQHLTVSAGIATSTENTDSLSALICEADSFLYRAKQAGRDCCCHRH